MLLIAFLYSCFLSLEKVIAIKKARFFKIKIKKQSNSFFSNKQIYFLYVKITRTTVAARTCTKVTTT